MTGRDQRQDRPIEDLVAANAFRDTLVPRADGFANGNAPLWHGWAVFDAFLAGLDHARQSITRDDTESPHPDGRS